MKGLVENDTLHIFIGHVGTDEDVAVHRVSQASYSCGPEQAASLLSEITCEKHITDSPRRLRAAEGIEQGESTLNAAEDVLIPRAIDDRGRQTDSCNFAFHSPGT